MSFGFYARTYSMPVSLCFYARASILLCSKHFRCSCPNISMLVPIYFYTRTDSMPCVPMFLCSKFFYACARIFLCLKIFHDHAPIFLCLKIHLVQGPALGCGRRELVRLDLVDRAPQGAQGSQQHTHAPQLQRLFYTQQSNYTDRTDQELLK